MELGWDVEGPLQRARKRTEMKRSVWFRYNAVNFFPNPAKSTPELAHEG